MQKWFRTVLTAFALGGCKAPSVAPPDATSSTVQPDAGSMNAELVANLPPEYQRQLAHLLKSPQMAESLKPGEAPEVAKKMVDHTRRIIELLRQNLRDCAGIENALKAHLEANKAELLALRVRGDAEQAQLSPDERTKRTIQTFMLLSSLGPELVQVQSMLLQSCPAQAGRIAAQLKSIAP